MMLYLDTSLLVAALTDETEGARVKAWRLRQPPDSMVISDWVITEFSAALSVKLRTGQITPEDRARTLAIFAATIVESLDRLPIPRAHFHAAARLADSNGIGLHAGDALHLAIAREHGATLCSLDRRLVAAGGELGVSTLLV